MDLGLDVGRCLMEKKRYGEAVGILLAVEEERKNWLELVRSSTGLKPEVKETARKLLIHTRIYLSDCLIALKRYPEAERTSAEALELASLDPDGIKNDPWMLGAVYLIKGSAQSHNNKIQDGLNNIETAIKIAEDNNSPECKQLLAYAKSLKQTILKAKSDNGGTRE
jgi:hypothetical protein